MNMPKISIIMSVYNGMPYLKKAIRSILTQTYKNFEFIIVDDASTDRSWEYLKSVKDKRVKPIKNKKNLGLAASLNIALAKSSGEYIARMDADDISLPKRLETQLELLQKDQSIELCGVWAKLIDENNKVIGRVHKPKADKDIKKMSRWITGIIHPTWLGRRKMFEKLKGYNPDYDMAEDLDFLIRAKDFKMANIEKELLLWRNPQQRRSQSDIEKIYRQSLRVRWQHFLKGNLTILFLPYLIRSLITTYLFPARLKIFLNKKAGLL